MDETKKPETEVEEEQKETEVDLSKYESNLEREEVQSDNSKLIEMLDKQDAMITQLKAEIKNLKDLNMALALTNGTGKEPADAVSALNAAFSTEK